MKSDVQQNMDNIINKIQEEPFNKILGEYLDKIKEFNQQSKEILNFSLSQYHLDELSTGQIMQMCESMNKMIIIKTTIDKFEMPQIKKLNRDMEETGDKQATGDADGKGGSNPVEDWMKNEECRDEHEQNGNPGQIFYVPDSEDLNNK